MQIRVDRRGQGGKKVFRPRILAHTDEQGYASVVFHLASFPLRLAHFFSWPGYGGPDRSTGWWTSQGARSGATLKDTMVQAGQASEKAALIYQQSDLERQQEVASGLALVRAARDKPAQKSSGADLVRDA